MGRPTKESQVVQFAWLVPKAGYRWVEPHELEKGEGDDWLIVDEPRDAPETQYRITAPLRDTPALFRTLAELKPTREEILEFSSQHGLLLGPQPPTKRVPLRVRPTVNGERKQTWLNSIALMQEVWRWGP